MRGIFTLLLLICLVFDLFSQNGGVSPSLTLNYKVNNKVKLTTKVESYYYIDSQDDNKLSGTDFQIFYGFKPNPFWYLATGYQTNLENPAFDYHRAIFQISYLQFIQNYRLGHRYRTSQTFTNSDMRFRQRYRISFELPLQGREIDASEFYSVFYEEILISTLKKNNKAENRITAAVGYYFRNKEKLQLNFEYSSNPNSKIKSNEFWVKIAWYVNL